MPSMLNLLLNSGNSSALSQLSSQFGLSEDQARQAVEALAPALSIGMKRNVSTPMGAGAFIEALSSGRHEQYADRPEYAGSDVGIAEGNKILGHLLGSKDVSRAVTHQASQVTGIGQSALKKMLPIITSMVMGSMSKSAKQGIAGGGDGILGKIMEGMLGGGLSGGGNAGGSLGDILGNVLGGGGTRQSAPQRRTSDGDNPLGRIFEDMLSGQDKDGRPQSTPQRRTTDEGELGQVFDDASGEGNRSSGNWSAEEVTGEGSLGDMLDGFLDGDDEEPQIEAGGQRRHPPSGGGLTEIFGDMMDSGRKSDDPYQSGLESIFDDFLKK